MNLYCRWEELLRISFLFTLTGSFGLRLGNYPTIPVSEQPIPARVDAGMGLKPRNPRVLGPVNPGVSYITRRHVCPFGATFLSKRHMDALNSLAHYTSLKLTICWDYLTHRFMLIFRAY